MKSKRILTIDEIYNSVKKDRLNRKYDRSLKESKGSNDNLDGVNVGKYSLKRHINNYLKTSRPSSRSLKWLYQEVFKNPDIYKFTKNLLYQGHLYTFRYFNPKYKDTKQLPWFDKFPLVLSLGPVVTNEGLRNIGLNLHLVPPKVRILILCYIFEYHKKMYRYQIYYKQKIKGVPVSWKSLVEPLLRYGITFCIRMYIPNRQNQIVQFPLRDWYRAVFIPSRAYDGIKANQLIKEWQKHIKTLGYSTNPNLNWQSKI